MEALKLNLIRGTMLAVVAIGASTLERSGSGRRSCHLQSEMCHVSWRGRQRRYCLRAKRWARMISPRPKFKNFPTLSWRHDRQGQEQNARVREEPERRGYQRAGHLPSPACQRQVS